MSIKKLINRLDDFFDLSKKKQKKKSDKLLKIINSLIEKKSELKKEMRAKAKNCKHSKEMYDFCKEYKVITKMLKKAQKQANLLDESIAGKNNV